MEEKKVVAAAYVPFKTFENCLDHLKAHGVPNVIDRSYFPSKSGAKQGQIVNAFRFLNLIDDNGKPSEILDKLVADTESRKETLKQILEKSYANLFNADLARITPNQFESLFSTDIYGVSGDTKGKAKSFLFFALKYAEVPFSKLLTQRMRSPRKKSGITNNNGIGESEKEKNDDSTKPPPPPPKDDDTIHGKAIKAIELVGSNKKTVWIGTDANMFEIKRGKDLDFVLKLIELFDEYENKNKAKEPTEETFVAEGEVEIEG